MAYADVTFYRETYIGRNCLDDDTLEKWLSRASDDIDILTGMKIDTATMYAFELTLLKKATCAQAENYLVNGDGVDGDFESASLGSFSYSGGKIETGKVCENSFKYLELTGLLFGGVPCARFR